jgi:hypothetical protein
MMAEEHMTATRWDADIERKADLNIDTWTESREPEGRVGQKASRR